MYREKFFAIRKIKAYIFPFKNIFEVSSMRDKRVEEVIEIDYVVLKIESKSISATLEFIENELVGYSIYYEGDKEKIDISGANVDMIIFHFYYIDKNDKEQTVQRCEFDTPEDKDLLAKFNRKILKQYEEKIAKRQISENEARELLVKLLDYIDKLTKGGVSILIKKVKNAVKSENIRVGFHRPEEVMEIIYVDNKIKFK